MDFKNKFKKQGKDIFKSKDEGGLSFTYYLNLKKEGIEKYKDEDNTDYKVDIIPYEIETDKHPNGKKGEKRYNMDLWVHKGIGANKESFLCMKKNYKQPCPICDQFLQLQNEGVEYEEIKHLIAKRRSIYWFLLRGKLYVADLPFKTFEELWLDVVDKYDRKGEDIFPVYFDGEGCTSLEYSTTNKAGIGRYVQFDFSEIEDYNPDLEKQVISLEKLLVIPSIEEMEMSLNGLSQIEDDEEKEIEEEINHNKDETKDDIFKDDYYNDVVLKEVAEQEKKGIENKTLIKKKKKTKKEDVCVCPEIYGTVFGEDWDEYEHCDKCKETHKDNYEACKEKSKES